MSLMSIYQETAKVGVRTTLQMQKAADRATHSLIESSISSTDTNGNMMKEYVNNAYQVRQELLNSMADAAEKAITNYPFKTEIEEFNTRALENTKKVFELFYLPIIAKAQK